MSSNATEESGDPNVGDDGTENTEETTASPTQTNKNCDCQCTAAKSKQEASSSIKLIPISYNTFFGLCLDDLILDILNLLYGLAERFGLIKKPENNVVKKKEKEEEEKEGEPGTSQEVDKKDNDADIVEWLHDEFVKLADDLKAANECNAPTNMCCCGEGNRSDLVSLQARKNVLNQLAEVLDKRNN